MTIDEVIEQFKYDAECNRADLDLSYAEDNEQVAEWLEELKSYRASVFSGDMTQKMLKEEYCKAVDDFAESVKNLIADSSVIRFKDIDEIAEQLKAGGNIELSEYSKSQGNRTGKQKATIEAESKVE